MVEIDWVMIDFDDLVQHGKEIGTILLIIGIITAVVRSIVMITSLQVKKIKMVI